MMISSRGRYALRVMIDLAENSHGNYTAMKTVSERQGISLKYLEKILPVLTKNGLIEGQQGKGGGYRLCRRPEEYTVGEIIERMEGSLNSGACTGGDSRPCPRAEECETLPLWAEYDRLTHDYFYGKKLSDLIGRK